MKFVDFDQVLVTFKNLLIFYELIFFIHDYTWILLYEFLGINWEQLS